MTGPAYAGRTVDVPADVPLVPEKRRPRVQTHTHLNRAGGKRYGHLSRRGHCARRGREGKEERIALHVDLHAVVAGTGLSYEAAMLSQCLPITLGTEILKQPRRTFDVSEEEGDRSERKIASHRGIMRQNASTVAARHAASPSCL